MAKPSPAAIPVIDKSEEKAAETKWDDSIAFPRYLMIRSFDPGYVTKEKFYKSGSGAAELANVTRFVTGAEPAHVINLLKKAVESNYPTALDCALWCLAQCFHKSKTDVFKKLLRESFNVLVKTSDDLLIFAYYFSRQNDRKLNFGSTMRAVLTSWYDSKSPTELLELVFATPTVHEVRHDDIIKQLHPKFENEDKNAIVRAIYKSYAQIKEAAETSTFMKKILKYRDLKRCLAVHEVLSILKRKDYVYKLNHLPNCAYKSADVLELILPNMTFVEVLDNVVGFCDKQLLKAKLPVSRKICNALQVSNKVIKDAKLNPLYVYSIVQSLEKKLEVASETTPKKCANEFVVKKVRNVFYQTLNDQPTTGCRFYVTVNMRKNSKRQSTVGNIDCNDAQKIFTLALLRAEKEVTVMSFTDDRNKLKSVAWNAKTDFLKADDDLDLPLKKTKENISWPLKKAAEDKKKVDVFVIFVSSVGRTRGANAKPPVEDLHNYRKAMDLKTTKLVVVNMARPSTDFVYSKRDESEAGVLEIVGFNPESLRIIEAFARNSFA